MKHFCTTVLFFFLYVTAFAQAGTWTWMKGDSTVNSVGNFGIQGVASSSNEPPARYAGAYWTDTAKNFWIWGGASMNRHMGGSFVTLSDLWKFDPLINQWTWMNGNAYLDSTTKTVRAAAKGVYSPLNIPGGRGYGVFTWVTPDNHLWMYSSFLGADIDSNILWQYNPSINQWAWMHVGYKYVLHGIKGIGDSMTCPGMRSENNTAWVDANGDLWLFGGMQPISLQLYQFNDMWKYDVAAGKWIWMSGSSRLTPPYNWYYGTQGVPSDSAAPPNRINNVFWKEDDGNFRLYGGARWGSLLLPFPTQFFLDDWRFNPQTLQWTWLNGPQFYFSNDGDVWTDHCDTNELNHQGGTFENRAVWKVCDKVVLNYKGGADTAANGLWAYITDSYQWVKISEAPLSGYYGTKGVADVFNYPSSRGGPASFTDKQGNLWMFGGMHIDLVADTSLGKYNDLWKYEVDSTCFGISYCTQNCQSFSANITATQTIFCPSDSAQICAPSGFTNYLWNTGETTSCINTQLGGNYYVTVTEGNGCTAESNHIAISVFPLPSVSITVAGDTLKVFDASTQQWYLNGTSISGATNETYIATQGGSYTVAVTDSNGCTAFSSPVLITGVDNITEEDVVSVYPNPSHSSWQLTVGSNLIGGVAEVFDAEGRLVFKSEIRNPQSEIAPAVSRGVYLLRVSSDKCSITRKLVRL